ncbi:MAG: site-specific integrase [Clostridia bacterium]|nr:site-specific integrase [Clostridia bacterium]
MAKRGNGEGSIRKIGNRYIAKIQVGWLPNGHPKIKSFSSETYGGAVKRMRKYMSDIEKGDCDVNLTISAGLHYWLENFKSLELKDSSFNRLEVTIDSNIIPYIGHFMTKELDSSVVQTQLINRLVSEGKSYSTIKKAYLALNAYYKKLIAMNMIERNPMLGVTLPSQKIFKSKPVRCLTSDERERFIAQATARCSNGTERYRYGYIYVFMMFTGLRCSEMLGLTWKHIDLENKRVSVSQSLVTVKDRYNTSENKYITKLQDSTKTLSGIREIPLCKQAVEAISKYKEMHYDGDINSYVVLSSKGNPLKTRHFERSVNYIYNQANIDAGGLHILRHTFASMLFEKNVDIKVISRLLGHSDVSTTYNIYIHLTHNQEQDAVELLDDIE